MSLWCLGQRQKQKQWSWTEAAISHLPSEKLVGLLGRMQNVEITDRSEMTEKPESEQLEGWSHGY